MFVIEILGAYNHQRFCMTHLNDLHMIFSLETINKSDKTEYIHWR